MQVTSSIGRALIILGITIALVGVVFLFGGRLSWLSRLPGDMVIQKKNFTLFLPITTSILISVLLSIIIALLRRR
jgi:hypothetical protein